MNDRSGFRRVAFWIGGRLTWLSDWALGEPVAGPSSLVERILMMVIIVAGAFAGLSRFTAGTIDTLWAEDGAVFMTGAYARPWFADVLLPYNGYAHVYPRTIASVITAVVNLADVPIAVATAACVTTALVAAVVFWTLRARIPQWPIRFVLAAMIVSLPLASIEVNGSIANDHWYLMVALFAVLISRQRNVAGRVVAAVVIVFAVLSDPLTLLFAPLVVLRFFDRGPRSRWIVPGAFVVAAIVQVIVVRSTTLTPSSPFSIGGLLRSLAFRVYLEGLVGHYLAVDLYARTGYVALILAAVAVLAIATIAVLARTRGFVIVAFVAATGFFMVAVALRWTGDMDPIGGIPDGGTRYQLVPICLLLMGFACTVSALVRSPRAALRATTLAASGLVIIAVSFSAAIGWRTTDRDGPWQLANAQRECTVPHPPQDVLVIGSPSGFPLVIACSTVRSNMTAAGH